MELNDETIAKFKKLYFEEFKEEITTEQARERFMRGYNLVRLVLKPRPTKMPGTMFPGVFIPGIDDYKRNGEG